MEVHIAIHMVRRFVRIPMPTPLEVEGTSMEFTHLEPMHRFIDLAPAETSLSSLNSSNSCCNTAHLLEVVTLKELDAMSCPNCQMCPKGSSKAHPRRHFSRQTPRPSDPDVEPSRIGLMWICPGECPVTWRKQGALDDVTPS